MNQNISDLDWARLAAYIDGEGTISIPATWSKSKKTGEYKRPHFYVRVDVSNTDPRLTDWCLLTFGGNVYVNSTNHRNNSKWAPCFQWHAACNIGEFVLRGCLPYFLLKREQAEIALAFVKTLDKARSQGVKGRSTSLVLAQLKMRTQLMALKGARSKDWGINQAIEKWLSTLPNHDKQMVH